MDPVATQLDALHHADQHLVRTVDSLEGASWEEPSLLPGWTRAHVVAHLALNAEGFERALGGVQDGEPFAIYDSDTARDEAIAELAAEDPSAIRDRLFGAGTALRHTFGALTPEQWESGTVERTPGGPVWQVSQMLTARRQEVEIHHADLGLAYGPADWPEDFASALLDRVVGAQAFAVNATDAARSRVVGEGEAVVTGTTADLAWWLLGRGAGAGLSYVGPALPEVSPWQRPRAR